MHSWSRYIVVALIAIVGISLSGCTVDKLSIEKGTISYPRQLASPKQATNNIVIPEVSQVVRESK